MRPQALLVTVSLGVATVLDLGLGLGLASVPARGTMRTSRGTMPRAGAPAKVDDAAPHDAVPAPAARSP